MAGNSDLSGSGWVNDPNWGSQNQNPRLAYLGYQHVPVTKSDADAVESDALFSLVIQPRTLGANSALRISSIWSVPNGAATKRIRGRFGGTVLWNLDLSTHLVFAMEMVIANRNSMSSQIARANNTTTFGAIGSVGAQTFTLDFATAQTLTLTAQWPVAGAGSNVITLEDVIVEHLYAP